jgi:hypothetical protein
MNITLHSLPLSDIPSLNGTVERIEAEDHPLLRAMHEEWDLKKWLKKHEDAEFKIDTVSPAIRALTESQANRLRIALTAPDADRKDLLKAFFGTLLEDTVRHFDDAKRKAKKNIRHLNTDEQERKEWLRQIDVHIQRHGRDGRDETPGQYIDRPGALRKRERNLIMTSLDAVMNHLFEGDRTKNEQQMLDIGAWDGAITKHLSHHFSHVVAIEQNENRYLHLERRAGKRITPIFADMVELMKNPSSFRWKDSPIDEDDVPLSTGPFGDLVDPYFASDAILLSHVLYFFQRDEQDIRLLKWCMTHMKNKDSIMAILLNEQTHVPGSRGELRHGMGVRETHTNPRMYEEFLRGFGLSVHVMHPTLTVTAKGDKSREALKDILRFNIPGNLRHDDQRLEDYVDYLREVHDGVYQHPVRLILASSNPNRFDGLPSSTFGMGHTETKTFGQYQREAIQRRTKERPVAKPFDQEQFDTSIARLTDFFTMTRTELEHVLNGIGEGLRHPDGPRRDGALSHEQTIDRVLEGIPVRQVNALSDLHRARTMYLISVLTHYGTEGITLARVLEKLRISHSQYWAMISQESSHMIHDIPAVSHDELPSSV